MPTMGGYRERLSFALQRAKGIPIEVNLRKYEKILKEIQAFDLAAVSDRDLENRAHGLRQQARTGAPLDALLPEAYALTAEACRRELGQSPHDVQLIAAIVLHHGRLAQMKTGEGKTLAAVFPAFLHGLGGQGVHVMTANDYLARRDAEWMGGVLRRLGTSTGYAIANSSTAQRRRAYNADVTYLTARQAGFDFLSDSLCCDAVRLVQREAEMAIIDEADFILIDEARIPLVIASSDDPAEIDPRKADTLARALHREQDYTVDRAGRNCILTIAGQRRVEEMTGCGGMHEEKAWDLFAAVHVALHAHHLLQRDVDYIVTAGRLELVDGFTGRVAQKRRWPYGIQTALEVKEGLELQPQGRVAGSITVRNLIRRYALLAALTATAVPAAAELSREYGLSTVVIPPHRTDRTVHLPDRVFATAEAKMGAVIDEIVSAHGSGRPVLVGTSSVRDSEELAQRIRSRHIGCQVLNARNDRREAALVSRAGTLGCVTIATNMAGRGTDIKLGGDEGRHRERIETLGGLYVIGTNRHESVRVDDQLRGRAGRHGDPGLTRFFVSLEDDLFERYGVSEFLPRGACAADCTGELTDRRVNREIARAQSIIEEQYSEMRRTLKNYSQLVELQRKDVEHLRRAALLTGDLPEGYRLRCEAHRAAIARERGAHAAAQLMRWSFISALDRFWADHLALADELREGIHLQRYARREPLLVFIKELSEAFDAGVEAASRGAGDSFCAIDPSRCDRQGLPRQLRGPSSTWTYMINDDPFPPFSLAMIARADVAALALMTLRTAVFGPFLLIAAGLTGLRNRLQSRSPEASDASIAPPKTPCDGSRPAVDVGGPVDALGHLWNNGAGNTEPTQKRKEVSNEDNCARRLRAQSRGPLVGGIRRAWVPHRLRPKRPG